MLKRCLTVLHYLRRKCKKYLYYCISCKYFLSFSTAGVGDDRFENVILKTVCFLCICAPPLESEYSFGLDVVQWLHSLCIVGKKMFSNLFFNTAYLSGISPILLWCNIMDNIFHLFFTLFMLLALFLICPGPWVPSNFWCRKAVPHLWSLVMFSVVFLPEQYAYSYKQ